MHYMQCSIKIWMWGIASIKKKWIQPPSDPQWGEAKHGHNLEIFFCIFHPRNDLLGPFMFYKCSPWQDATFDIKYLMKYGGVLMRFWLF